MVEQLKILKEKNKSVIYFDEIMDYDGVWSESTVNSNKFKKVVEVPYSSDEWTYYLATNNDKDFYFYRCEK